MVPRGGGQQIQLARPPLHGPAFEACPQIQATALFPHHDGQENAAFVVHTDQIARREVPGGPRGWQLSLRDSRTEAGPRCGLA